MRHVEETNVAFTVFSDTLKASGLRAALAYLLSLTDYRYLAIFRFQDGRLICRIKVISGFAAHGKFKLFMRGISFHYHPASPCR